MPDPLEVNRNNYENYLRKRFLSLNLTHARIVLFPDYSFYDHVDKELLAVSSIAPTKPDKSYFSQLSPNEFDCLFFDSIPENVSIETIKWMAENFLDKNGIVYIRFDDGFFLKTLADGHVDLDPQPAISVNNYLNEMFRSILPIETRIYYHLLDRARSSYGLSNILLKAISRYIRTMANSESLVHPPLVNRFFRKIFKKWYAEEYTISQNLSFLKEYLSETEKDPNLKKTMKAGIRDFHIATRFSFVNTVMQTFVNAFIKRDFKEVGTGLEGSLLLNNTSTHREAIRNGSYETFMLQARENTLSLDIEWLRTRHSYSPCTYNTLSTRQLASNSYMQPDTIDLAANRIKIEIKRFCRNASLVQLVDQVVRLCPSNESKELFLYRFIQDSLLNHPSIQILKSFDQFEDDPLAIIVFGVARCGQSSAVAAKLFEILGYESRVTQLYKHICAEVKMGSKWCVVDTAFFKRGLYPKNASGEWASLDELREQPQLLDSVPAQGPIFSYSSHYLRNIFGQPITGYVEGGLPWQRQLPSFYYFGNSMTGQDTSHIVNERSIKHTPYAEIRLSSHSRGWKYSSVQFSDVTKTIDADLGKRTICLIDEKNHMATLNFPKRTELFLNILYLTEYQVEFPEVFRWPEEEIRIVKPEGFEKITLRFDDKMNVEIN